MIRENRARPGERERAPRRTAHTERAIELSVASLAAGGDGVGRDESGRVTFVPMSAPGDALHVELVEEKKSFARGRIARIVTPSPHRVEPACPLFADERCGGCQWQHLEPAFQARAKAETVARELRKLRGLGMAMEPIQTPVAPYRWRRRARLHYARPRGAKRATIGFHGAGERRVTDVEACPQLAPALADALAMIREHLAPHLGSRGHIDMLAGHEGHVHVAITGFCAPRRAAKLVGKGGIYGTIMGVALHPPARGIGAAEREGDAAERNTEPVEWGKRSIPLEPGLRGRAELFAQASLDGNRALLEAVKRAAGPLADKRVLELYAGSGNLTRVLVPEARELLASDSRPVPWLPNLVVGGAAEVLAELLDDGQYFDVAVLDPPRVGALDIMEALVDLHPARIVYVSCDPATLARDLDVLVAGGYRAESAQPLDLMPQTAHVEVVVTLVAVDDDDELDDDGLNNDSDELDDDRDELDDDRDELDDDQGADGEEPDER